MQPIDYAIFNELSMTPHPGDLAAVIRLLAGVFNMMKRASRLNFRRLKTRPDFKEVLFPSTPIDSVVRNLDRDSRILFLKVFDSPYLEEEVHEEAFVSRAMESIGNELSPDAEGLLSAHVADTLAVSFENGARWLSTQLSLTFQQDGSQHHETVVVRHASRADHLVQHVRWASRRTVAQQHLVPRRDLPLPNTKFSDQIVKDDWPAFFQSTSSLSSSEKTARLRVLAEDVAFINGYNHCPRRSSQNGQRAGALRQVFISAFTPTGREFYLSTDFEKPIGAFEFCDRNGRHLGEWLFSGERNAEADLSGGHDLIV